MQSRIQIRKNSYKLKLVHVDYKPNFEPTIFLINIKTLAIQFTIYTSCMDIKFTSIQL